MRAKLGLYTQMMLIVMFVFITVVFGQEGKVSKLPAPQMNGGRPLMQVLKDRKSIREFSNKKLSKQVISNLLWAAFGINRPDGKRTAPSAMNMQEIDIYAAMSDGLYLYDAKQNVLKLVLAEDVRVLTGKQPFVKEVPVNLIYVADLSKMGDMAETDIYLNTGADTGFISQNVYLYCASEGLATVVRGWIDKAPLEKKMNLRKDQKVILSQSVGYPKR